MKKVLITPEDLKQYMKGISYDLFIYNLKNKFKIPDEVPIWITAEWSKEDYGKME